MPFYRELTLEVADKAALRWAHRMVAECHYLRAPVDPRSRSICYLLEHQAPRLRALLSAEEASRLAELLTEV